MITFHGWGFLPSIFAPFEGDLSAKKIVTHSFGLHLVPKQLIRECEELIILSGFISLKERVKLRAMRMQLKKNPIAVLRAFYSEAGYDGEAPWLEWTLQVDALHADLLQMEEGLDIEPFLCIPKVSIWQASQDLIVKEDGKTLAENFPCAEKVFVEGGHMATLQRWKEKEQFSRPSAVQPQVTEISRYFSKK